MKHATMRYVSVSCFLLDTMCCVLQYLKSTTFLDVEEAKHLLIGVEMFNL